MVSTAPEKETTAMAGATRQTVKTTGLRLLLIAALVPVLLSQAGCDQATPEPPAASTGPASAESDPQEPVSDAEQHLEVVGLEDIKTIIAESAAADRVLVIDFWATWCVPCVEMFPSLHEGLIARGDVVRPVSITLDDPSREPAAVAFLARHHALHDAYIIKNDSQAQQALPEGLGNDWKNLAVPAILVYDFNGELSAEFLEGGSTLAILEHVDGLLDAAGEAKP